MTSEGDNPYDEQYYEGNGQSGDRPALRWFTRLVKRYLGDGPMLDFGCGTGHLLRRLSELGPAEGFEVSEYSARTARTTAPGCNVHTRVEDVPTGRFAGLTAIHVCEHLPDAVLSGLIDQWRRVLRPDGKVLCVMPDLGGRGHAIAGKEWLGFSDPTHINLKTHEAYRDFFLQHGLRVLNEGSDGLWNWPYSSLPLPLDAARHSLPMAAQFLSGRLVLPPGSGESSVFVLDLGRTR